MATGTFCLQDERLSLMLGKLNYKSMLLIGGFFIFLLSLLFAPADKPEQWNTVALVALMVFFWIFEVIPIYVTALFPFVLAVPLGVLDSSMLAASYGDRMVFLFLGGFILSLALEKWDVHKQIAETIVRLMGTSKPRLILGFLIATGFLSMWISNTATALMMLPMAMSVISNLETERKSKFPLFLLLSVAYGASLGGMATLVGSPTNAAMAGILESNESIGITVDFWDWMKIGLPVSLLMTAAVFFFFWLMLGKERKEKIHGAKPEQKKWTANQLRVVSLFLLIVLLWSFRTLITKYTGIDYKDEGAAIFGAILLFIIPSSEKGSLLEWKDTRKLPWGILLLFGGGLAMAQMLEVNGIILEITKVFQKFSDTDVFIVLLVLVGIAIYATEVMSNLALVQVFIPVVALFALNSNMDVLLLCVPVTLAASCAFMLPISTPPNAIIFSSGLVKVSDMAKVGFVLNLVGVIIVTLFSYIFLT